MSMPKYQRPHLTMTLESVIVRNLKVLKLLL
jgi:hypothetical protein